ncbi:DNA adenine methylase [Pedobacter cryoconitis]|uniref:DNA adenine methylase n=1 Tax=Pedobacter cryoconitis TaxID=188932 RepID=UPI0016089032|nr:Dam family site-specific DNA-(adenine-N6)-methyltransferase [Pedobacter cryoconitis]MBB5647649.1 DNA adenine methylase [Pedobacter cryoconitis]
MKLIKEEIDSNIKPFLRWAGGKTWLLKHLKNVKKSNFNNYHEAFLGGAATYFYLQPTGHSYLSDLNGELIETYQAIKDDALGVINKLESFNNTEEEYYKIRSLNFDLPTDRAARFIYLNQTSFNGIYRVNLQGVYNVPFGFRKKNFLDKENLLSAQEALKNTSIKQSDFYDIINNVNSGDLVFLDPPYTVSHNLNGFIQYNEKIFSLEDQIRLSKLIDELKDKGVYYILTNAAHKTIKEIFHKGDNQFEFNRASLIGGTKAERGQTSEYIFTNVVL